MKNYVSNRAGVPDELTEMSDDDDDDDDEHAANDDNRP